MNPEDKLRSKALKYGIHFTPERARDFIKMVEDTMNHLKELQKEKQRQEVRKVLGVLNETDS